MSNRNCAHKYCTNQSFNLICMHVHLKVVPLAQLISSYCMTCSDAFDELQSQAEFGTELDVINNLCP